MIITGKTQGRFTQFEVLNASGEVVRTYEPFNNHITDLGLNLMGTESDWLKEVFLGTGNTPPSDSDVALELMVATNNAPTTITEGVNQQAPYAVYKEVRWTVGPFSEERDLTEVGVGVDQNQLYSRTLIKNSSNAAIVVKVLEGEYVRVTYRNTAEISADSVTGSFQATIKGVDTTVTTTSRAAKATDVNTWKLPRKSDFIKEVRVYAGAIGDVTAVPSGVNAVVADVVARPYDAVAAPYTQFFDVTIPAAAGNLAGGKITSVLAETGLGAMQIQFSPAFEKDANISMTLELATRWMR